MKKEGIQTRNRKLANKAKKKRGSVVDFFAPFEKSYYSPMTASAGAAAAASAGYLANQMSQYYSTAAATQFMTDAAFAASTAYGNHLTAAAASTTAAAAATAAAQLSHEDHRTPSTSPSVNMIPSAVPKPDLVHSSSHHLPCQSPVLHTSSPPPHLGSHEGSLQQITSGSTGHLTQTSPYSLTASAGTSHDNQLLLGAGICKASTTNCLETNGANPVSAMT